MTREQQLEARLQRIIELWKATPRSEEQFAQDMGQAIQEAEALLRESRQ